MSRSVKLQRRHFEFIADVLLELKPSMDDSEHGRIVRWIGNRLGTTNTMFDDAKFYNRSRGIKPARVRKTKVIPSVASEDTNYWE